MLIITFYSLTLLGLKGNKLRIRDKMQNKSELSSLNMSAVEISASSYGIKVFLPNQILACVPPEFSYFADQCHNWSAK